jgi:hypothetical protein
LFDYLAGWNIKHIQCDKGYKSLIDYLHGDYQVKINFTFIAQENVPEVERSIRVMKIASELICIHSYVQECLQSWSRF